MNQTPFIQVQYLLNDLKLQINKVNEIINQMNIIIVNQINNQNMNQCNMQLNDMINYMNMINNNQMNFNINNNNFFAEKREALYCNISFVEDNGNKTFISIDIEKTINDLLNEFCRKNNCLNLLDNYDKHFIFFFDAKKLNQKKEEKIKNIIRGLVACISVTKLMNN